MKKRTVWGRSCAFSLLILVHSVFAFASAPQTLAHTLDGTVTKVVDGDTIHFEINRTKLKVRMMGMDAPEMHLASGHGMVGQDPWGRASTDHLASLLPVGSQAQLVVFGKDKYGRTLGKILFKGDDINLRMVKDGWAIPYIICDGESCNDTFFESQHVSEYLAACETARKDEAGIFSPRQALKEMPFEFRLRIQRRTPDKYVGDIQSKNLHKPADYKQVDLCSRIFFMDEKTAQARGFK